MAEPWALIDAFNRRQSARGAQDRQFADQALLNMFMQESRNRGIQASREAETTFNLDALMANPELQTVGNVSRPSKAAPDVVKDEDGVFTFSNKWITLIQKDRKLTRAFLEKYEPVPGKAPYGYSRWRERTAPVELANPDPGQDAKVNIPDARALEEEEQ